MFHTPHISPEINLKPVLCYEAFVFLWRLKESQKSLTLTFFHNCVILICSQRQSGNKLLSPTQKYSSLTFFKHLLFCLSCLDIFYCNVTLCAAHLLLEVSAAENQLPYIYNRCTPSLATFLVGELAVPLFLVDCNICTSHFVAGNDVELFSKTASLNCGIFIKRRLPLWRGGVFQWGAAFKLFASSSLSSGTQQG